MPKFRVQITETLQKIIEVEAANEDDALGSVQSDWGESNIILDSDDFNGVDFEVVE